MANSHLVVLFVTTAGQNGENLGSDEEQIVSFVYLLYDVTNNKVVAVQHHYVRPTAEDLSETVLTEECRIQTGMNEEAIKNAQPLEHVLDEFERFISSKEMHPDHGSKPFVFLCDGPLHLRLCLHPEGSNKNIQLPYHYHKYFDIRKEFKKFYKVEVVNCIKDMLDFLSLEPDQSVEYGVKHCQEMASIIQRLVSDGHPFSEPEHITPRLEPGICSKDDDVDDDVVIRARGLPWQSSDQDIAKFFVGLNVAKGGVALCLSQQGRRNGEALIRFETKEHRDLALRKHKHHLGQRYIEVYRASGKDFLNVAGGNNTEAQAFLSRHSNGGGQVIVRMRGLPYSCTSEQVLDFFRSGEAPTEVLDGEEGILFVHQADGRATGDAFVLFANDTDANKALAKHRQCIGTRYIELFKSTTAEVQQVLNRSMDPRAPVESTPDSSMGPLIPQIPQTALPGMAGLAAIPGMHGLHQTIPAGMTTVSGVPTGLPSMSGMSGMPGMPSMPGIASMPGGAVLPPQQIITSGTQRDCLRMRGLPFEATVQDILTFLGELSRNIVYQGVHMVYNAQGTPSGEAFIQMDSEQSAEISALSKHKKYMFIGNKKRYIEVIQCSGEDMNLVLTQGVSPATLPSAGGVPCSTYMSLPAAAPIIPGRPLISPGGTVLTPTHAAAPQFNPSGSAAAAAAAALAQPAVGLYPYAAATAPTAMAASQPHVITAGTPATTASIASLQHPMSAMTHLPQRAGPYSPYQPILYWYPSPPVSPQSTYYMHPSGPSTVVMKGLPYTAQVHDILGFFDGIYEVMPDVQVQRGPDGRPNGEAFITFGSRTEAERAITERNRKLVGNRFVELHMA